MEVFVHLNLRLIRHLTHPIGILFQNNIEGYQLTRKNDASSLKSFGITLYDYHMQKTKYVLHKHNPLPSQTLHQNHLKTLFYV